MESDVLLHPGELYFGHSPNRIRTVLGSCVAVTVWREKIQVGGMCHFLLQTPYPATGKPIDARYGDVALEQLYQQMCLHARPETFNVGIYGGGSVIFGEEYSGVGDKNVACALEWVNKHNLNLKRKDVLGNLCRTLILDLQDGAVLLKRYRPELEGLNDEH